MVEFVEDRGVLADYIEKSSKEVIWIGLNEYKGKRYIDLRTYFKNEEEKYCPTSKGITLSPESFPDLLEAIISLGQMLGYDLDTSPARHAEENT